MLDASLCWCYEEMVETETKNSRFLQRMQKELSLFAGQDDIALLVGANGAYTERPHSVALVMEACETGRAVFASAWLSCSRQIFLDRARQGLADLERMDYADDHNEAFKKMMDQEVQKLRSEGHKRGKNKWHGMVLMHGVELNITYDFAGDELDMMYWARVKTIACNSQEIEPMPWEQVLIPKWSIGQCPAHLKLPGSVLEPLRKLREALVDMLDGRSLTLAEMTRVMKKNCDELMDVHRSFLLDMTFLETKADDFLRPRVPEGLRRNTTICSRTAACLCNMCCLSMCVPRRCPIVAPS